MILLRKELRTLTFDIEQNKKFKLQIHARTKIAPSKIPFQANHNVTVMLM